MQAYTNWPLAALTFLCEIVLWIGVGRAVWQQFSPAQGTLALVVGILAALAFVFLWALFLSPKASFRLSLWLRIIVISVASIGTGYLLYKSGDRIYGLILMVPVTLIQAVGQYVMDDM